MEAKIKRKRKRVDAPPVLVYSTTVKHSKQKPLEMENKSSIEVLEENGIYVEHSLGGKYW